ncbi:MAG: hypothetical protein MI807_07770 [Verrucomicrobiales bacterium]|nr:hypothetical protein [Verrucomicrobiales bacterium]
MTAIVDGLKAEYADVVVLETTKVGDGNSKEEIENSDIKVHGIIAKNADGEIVTTVEGHSYGEEKVKEVIALLLED